MYNEMLVRLKMDPGQRTLGELLQERQWAVQEIEWLRTASGVASADSRRRGRPITATGVAVSTPVTTAPPATPAFPHQMLRLPELCKMVGLSRGCIYQMMGRREFPSGVHVGARARRWRMAEVVAWLQRLGSEG